MAIDDPKDPGMAQEDREKPTGVENLFIGHFDDNEEIFRGHINGDIPCDFKGDILIYRQPEKEGYEIEHLRSLSLYGMPDPDVDADPPLGVITLAGPVGDWETVPTGDKDVAYHGKFDMHLHYHGLARLEPRDRDDDSGEPIVETIEAELTLDAEEWNEEEVSLGVDLKITELVDERLGQIGSIAFDPFSLTCYLSGSHPESEEVEAHSLRGCTGPTQPCGSQVSNEPYNQELATVHRVRLRFINVSTTNLSVVDLERRCQHQIDGACEVWGNKAAINLLVEPEIDEAPDELKECYREIGDPKDKWLPCAYAQFLHSGVAPACNDQDPCQGTGPADPHIDHLEVYLVDRIIGTSGGGAVPPEHAGEGSAYCILEVGRLPDVDQPAGNKYLLAHELGHALGLKHPHPFAPCSGSGDSIMQPGTPNSPDNTRRNCKIFAPRFGDEGPACTKPRNPLFRPTTARRTFCLDA